MGTSNDETTGYEMSVAESGRTAELGRLWRGEVRQAVLGENRPRTCIWGA